MNLNKFWTKKEKEDIPKAKNFTELSVIAIKILERIVHKTKTNPCYQGKKIVMVCGPITTGGTGTVEGNIKKFQKTIRKLSRQGYIVFNQICFERPMWRIKKKLKGTTEKRDQTLLEQFYRPIFETFFVDEFHFIHDWQSSFGASWENKVITELGILIHYLPEEF